MNLKVTKYSNNPAINIRENEKISLLNYIWQATNSAMKVSKYFIIMRLSKDPVGFSDMKIFIMLCYYSFTT